jgi:hypothetical protein
MAIRPASITSMPGMSTVPPLASILVIVSSALSTLT